MAFRALVSIDGVALPTPSSYIGTTSTLVDSGRNAEGRVVGAVVRDDLAKVEMTFNFVTVEQWSFMLKKFSPKYGGNFYNNVTFFCDVSGTWETREMYVSDRTSSGMVKVDPNTGIPFGYKGAKFSLIER